MKPRRLSLVGEQLRMIFRQNSGGCCREEKKQEKQKTRGWLSVAEIQNSEKVEWQEIVSWDWMVCLVG